MRGLVAGVVVGVAVLSADPAIAQVRELGGSTAPTVALTFSPDGALMATAGADHVVRLWRPVNNSLVSEKTFPVAVAALAFRPDGQSLVIGDSAGQVTLWEWGTNRPRWLGTHADAVTGLAVGPDGVTVYSCGRDRMVKAWDSVAGSPRQSIGPLESAPAALAISPDGARLAVAGESGVGLYAAGDGQFARELPCPDGPVSCLAFSPDGRILSAACGEGTIRLWTLPEYRATDYLQGHRGPVRQISFDASGRRLCSVGHNGQTVIWDPSSGAAVFSHRFPAPCYCGAITPSGEGVTVGTLRPGCFVIELPRNLR